MQEPHELSPAEHFHDLFVRLSVLSRRPDISEAHRKVARAAEIAIDNASIELGVADRFAAEQAEAA